ncbi:MAG TPA: KUP/HAK/KT family potassium transporter, partial [Solirubrobacteraceae bacterium]|nr:KUP/HAK/KT family potassium transporter [Solirubrobacteraceae bacterium]
MPPSHPATAPRPSPARADEAPPTGHLRRSLNEAAHKLGYWPVAPAPRRTDGGGAPSAAVAAATDDDRDVVAHASKAVLGLGALGIVYGDLGTSPLYTVQTIFTQHRDAVHATAAGDYGIASLIFWALMLEISFKYAIVIMRAHNRGDGGIMALTALVQRRKLPRRGALITLGIFGAGLFFGDGMITPAVSVTSAVGGLNVVSPSFNHLVVPISLVILISLFAVQRFGTGAVGWMFGPVILVFFAVIAALGLTEVIAHPGVVQAISPVWGARFMIDHGVQAWLTLGGVVLCVTGAEALYADRGHFGAGPIRVTWFSVVLPAVLLSYLGQAALVLAHPSDAVNPFFLLAPSSLQLPLVFLATVATIIASQAAITGSYSVAKQAIQLGLLPRLKVIHTSNLEGQIYVPIINWFLCAGVVALVLIFQNSNRLTDIYGVAVTGTFILNTLLFTALARAMWNTSWWRLAPLSATFLIVEVAFFSSNLAKIAHGAWLSLGIGLLVAFVMVTWRRGREILTRNRIAEEGDLESFLAQLCESDDPPKRVDGTVIFLSPSRETTPLALRAEVEHGHALQRHMLIVSVAPIGIAHVEMPDRFAVEWVGRGSFKVAHVTLRVGYRDAVDIPAALALARKRGLLARNLDLEHASYYVSRMSITPTSAPGMARWRKALFVFMARNSTSPLDQFRLPIERTV